MTRLYVLTGSCNSTLSFGERCPFCGCDGRMTSEFHGYLLTMCTSCGEELPAATSGETPERESDAPEA